MDLKAVKRIAITLAALLGVGLAIAALFLLSRTAQSADEFNRHLRAHLDAVAAAAPAGAAA